MSQRDNTRVIPGDARRGEIEIVEERAVWANDTARLFNDRVRYPGKGGGAPVTAEQFRLGHAEGRGDGVVIAPIVRGDGDRGGESDRILLVRQFRHPTRMWMRELPRGGRAESEAPADAARRELREEVGGDAEVLHPLGRVAPDSGQLVGLPYLFAARVRRRGPQHTEATEAIDRVVAYTYPELELACITGAIVDAFTIAAVLRLRPHFVGEKFLYRPELTPRDVE